MIKNAFWNALSIIVFLAIIAVIAFFALIFINPYSALNPFPPPTLPASLNLPTFTPTFPQLPPTWTPGGPLEPIQGITLKPSSTPLATEPGAVIIVNTNPPIRLPTSTFTPTRSATATSAATRTPTNTPNLTDTALAQVVTNAALTAQARTQAAGATQTVNAMPPNPGSAVETHGVSNDTWQTTVSDPAFTWTPVSGASRYYVYWGTASTGTSASTVSSASFDPDAVTPGTYYLRLRTVFPWGTRPDWSTVFIFRFDNTSPSVPGSATETHGASSASWQNTISDPAFTWPAASDTGSGVARYDVYFGSNPNGEIVVATPSSAAYDPAALSSGTYYLRARAVDGVGNSSNWATLFEFRYDGTPPSVPANLQTGDSGSAAPTFTWSASTDDHSGFGTYQLFWGSGATCGGKNQPDQTGTSFTAPEITEAGDYILCVRAVDALGNTSSWAQAAYTYP